ncbi:MAG: phage polymerase-related protein [Marmoricola sp.]|jgi:uracil-DNA glycosylase family protein|nr:phage polymerase-related protein [Marmoricola sp.]
MAEDAERPGAAWWVPDRLEPGTLRASLQHCQGCELYRDATQPVPGEGPADAAVMVVGEQPGDQEDKAGRPFVGPAGKLLDRALGDAGLDPAAVFRTNAVKHFRWEAAHGKRLHKGPKRTHITACGPWLVAEIDMVRPVGVVLLGATAGSAVFGPGFRVTAMRGQVLSWPEESTRPHSWTPEWAVATAHPSAVLRSRQRDEDYQRLVDDLAVAAQLQAGPVTS